MEKILIKGGSKLSGDVNVSAAKNSVLPIIAASILSDDKCVINNIPMLQDVFVMSSVLQSLNANINIDKKNDKLIINPENINNLEPQNDLVKKIRASFLIMGPMLSKYGKIRVSFPGGCNIGTRPIDLHLKGFNALGAEVNIGHGFVEAKCNKLIGNKIYLDFPSVGATENIIMAAVLAKGETIIENAAEEPEIMDLVNFLISMGAKIDGAGTDTIVINGVDNLHGTNHTPIGDRIEAGTFMVAAAITKSKLRINGVDEKYTRPVVAKLREMGVEIDTEKESIYVNGDKKLNPIDIKTMPYPGFPTDMQPQMMSLLCNVEGTSIVTETVFENRFMHVMEMQRMGANIKINARSAIIEGGSKFTGCEVKATDLRAGAALILCGLSAQGVTEVIDIHHIDRGYVNIEDKFKKIGANIWRE